MMKLFLQAAGIVVVLTGPTSTRTLQREKANPAPNGRAVVMTHDNSIIFQTPGITRLVGQVIAANETASTQKVRRSIKAYNTVAEPLLPGGTMSAPD